jgi:uncharacterized membrane protein YraQ (UPF0718 family)/copper chaperone CopZ
MEIVISFILLFWQIVVQIAPYLLVGFFAAGLIHSFLSNSFVIKHLGSTGIRGIIKAALIAVPMPLCSCSVIPVASALKKNGASNAATTAFLIATPQTGIDNILVVYSFLGLPFALLSPVFTFFSGIIGGVLVSLFGNNKIINGQGTISSDDNDDFENKNAGFLKKIRKAIKYGFNTMPSDLAGSLLLGILITALIQIMMPDNFFENVTKNIFLQKLIMLAAGIPIYVCSSGSVPIAAALIAKGISPGSALVFLMVGPATNFATITTMSKCLGWRNMVLYLIAIASTSLLFGTLLDLIFDKFSFTVTGLGGAEHLHLGDTTIFVYIAAICLLVLLSYHFMLPYIQKMALPFRKLSASETYRIEIQGMQCKECAQKVRNAISSIKNVKIITINHKGGFAIIIMKDFDETALRMQIEKAGYFVQKIAKK